MRRTDKVKHNNNVTYRCHYHVVWCPKYRRKVITSLDPTLHNPPIDGDPGPVDERLKQIIRDVCDETGSELLELETMPDHVHLLVDCDPSTASTGSYDSSKDGQAVTSAGSSLTQTQDPHPVDQQLLRRHRRRRPTHHREAIYREPKKRIGGSPQP